MQLETLVRLLWAVAWEWDLLEGAFSMVCDELKVLVQLEVSPSYWYGVKASEKHLVDLCSLGNPLIDLFSNLKPLVHLCSLGKCLRNLSLLGKSLTNLCFVEKSSKDLCSLGKSSRDLC